MLQRLIHIWMYIIELRLYTYSGNRNELNKIKECVVKSIEGREISFNFYEKTRLDYIIRFGIVQVKVKTSYIIEAIFSEDFIPELKQHNEVKYYLDFNMIKWFNKDLVLDALLGNLVTYLEYKFKALK